MVEIKKVCHVMRRFTLGQWGGTESSVLNVSCNLEKRGIASVIYSTDMLEKAGSDEMEGVAVERYRYVFPWLFLSDEEKEEMELRGGSPLSLPLFFSLLKEKNLSLIHTHVHGRLGGIARTAARWRRVPYVISIHAGYYSEMKEEKKPKDKWEWGKAFGFALGEEKAISDADGIICVGKDEYEVLSEEYPDKRIYYLPNGVNVDRFRNADPIFCRSKLAIGEKERLVLSVSRIDEQKNQKLLVEAFAKYYQRYADAKLLLIGPVSSQKYRLELEQEAELLGIADRVIIIPGLSPHDPLLSSAFKAADMFILPSRIEPFGIVLLEAWAAGIPIIASRVGGIPGFTRNRGNALLFQSENEKQLLSAMLEVTEDRDLRERLIHNGRKEVHQYDWPEVTSRLLDIYQEVLKKERAEIL